MPEVRQCLQSRGVIMPKQKSESKGWIEKDTRIQLSKADKKRIGDGFMLAVKLVALGLLLLGYYFFLVLGIAFLLVAYGFKLLADKVDKNKIVKHETMKREEFKKGIEEIEGFKI